MEGAVSLGKDVIEDRGKPIYTKADCLCVIGLLVEQRCPDLSDRLEWKKRKFIFK